MLGSDLFFLQRSCTASKFSSCAVARDEVSSAPSRRRVGNRLSRTSRGRPARGGRRRWLRLTRVAGIGGPASRTRCGSAFFLAARPARRSPSIFDRRAVQCRIPYHAREQLNRFSRIIIARRWGGGVTSWILDPAIRLPPSRKLPSDPRHGTSPKNTKPPINRLKVDKRDKIEQTAILYSSPAQTTPIQSFKN